jgi:hypothetical protein
MFRKYTSFLLALSLVILLGACSDKGSDKGKEKETKETAAKTAGSVDSVAAPAAKVEPVPIDKAEKDKEANPSQLVVSNTAALPADVPVYPGSEMLEKSTNGELNRFVFKAADGALKIKEFYRSEMVKLGWMEDVGSKVDGLTYKKGEYAAKITPIGMGGGSQIYIFVSAPKALPAVDKNTPADDIARRNLGNLSNVVKFYEGIPKDVPVYPKSKSVETKDIYKYDKWREYDTNDSVKEVEAWYKEQMKSNGWDFHNDTSEKGDSMVIYKKPHEDGGVRFVGVRINDKQSFRHLTLVLYPKDTVVPVLRPPSEIAAQNPDQIEAMKKAQQDTKDYLEKKKKGAKQKGK